MIKHFFTNHVIRNRYTQEPIINFFTLNDINLNDVVLPPTGLGQSKLITTPTGWIPQSFLGSGVLYPQVCFMDFTPLSGVVQEPVVCNFNPIYDEDITNGPDQSKIRIMWGSILETILKHIPDFETNRSEYTYTRHTEYLNYTINASSHSNIYGGITAVHIESMGSGYPDTCSVIFSQPNISSGILPQATASYGLTTSSLSIKNSGYEHFVGEYIDLFYPSEFDPQAECSVVVTGVNSSGLITGFAVVDPGYNWTNSYSGTIMTDTDTTFSLIPNKYCISKIIINNIGRGYQFWNSGTLSANNHSVTLSGVGSGSGFIGYGIQTPAMTGAIIEDPPASEPFDRFLPDYTQDMDSLFPEDHFDLIQDFEYTPLIRYNEWETL